MPKIKGITVKLHVREEAGEDTFGRAIYNDTTVDVDNVLVTPVSSTDVINEMNLSGKTIAYELCLPKGDDHDWTNTEVEFFGEKFKTVGYPKELIEDMVPLSWNKKVQVERYG